MKTLNAIKRSKADKLTSIRNNGMVPAVVYGASVENTSISVPAIDFIKVLRNVGETSTMVLSLDGKNIDALIHDVQVDPVKGFPLHVDFLAVDMNKPVEVSIPLEFVGVAPAEKSGLGVLVKVIHEIDIQALPKDIPAHIEVDISSLATLENQIHAQDLVLPKGVSLMIDGSEIVALVSAVKEEKEAAPVDLSAIAVEKKGKKDEEAAAE